MLGGWPGTETSGDWEKVPATIPVMIFSLVYHDLAPGEYSSFSATTFSFYSRVDDLRFLVLD